MWTAHTYRYTFLHTVTEYDLNRNSTTFPVWAVLTILQYDNEPQCHATYFVLIGWKTLKCVTSGKRILWFDKLNRLIQAASLLLRTTSRQPQPAASRRIPSYVSKTYYNSTQWTANLNWVALCRVGRPAFSFNECRNFSIRNINQIIYFLKNRTLAWKSDLIQTTFFNTVSDIVSRFTPYFAVFIASLVW